MGMKWSKDDMPLLVVEEGGYEGVRRIAGKVAEDIGKVLGAAPEVTDLKGLSEKRATCIILCATLGKSPLLEELANRGLADFEGLMKEDGSTKREVYQIRRIFSEGKDGLKDCLKNCLKNQGAEGELQAGGAEKGDAFLAGVPESVLLIAGSDKRGTIYGMFALSEYIGVSPLCYWGDVEPVHRDILNIAGDIEILSKEPSVKYRGFFINDEWPCFGSWAGENSISADSTQLPMSMYLSCCCG